MSLTKYDSYKDSGVDWLGEVPSHWSYYRADDIGTLIRGNTGLKKDELLKKGEYVALQYGKTYKVDEVNDSFEYFVNSELYKKSQIVNRGDTIIISTSETIEDLGHSCFYNRSDLGLIGGEQILFKPNSKFIANKYFYYHSKRFCVELRKYATGLKVFRFNINDLKQILVAIPPLQEQQQIANYLDQQTKTIDKKIKLLETKIEHYQALKKSLINETVCRGLDKTVALKDSGIEWIGAIPEHWEVARLKDNISLFHGYSYSKEDLSDNTKNYLIKITQLKNQKIDISSAHELKEQSNKYRIYKNDLLIALSGATSGKVAIHNIEEKCYLNQRVAKIVSKEYDYKYLFYFFQLDRFVSQMFIISISTAQPNFTNKILEVNNLYLSIQEQQQIAKYLDEKTGIIDQIIANIQSQVERLKELRKSLINEVVTGKVRVPEMERMK